jgi:hypothetical protein
MSWFLHKLPRVRDINNPAVLLGWIISRKYYEQVSRFFTQGYQVVSELGRNREGGRITWLASDITTGRQVVLKQFCFAQGLVAVGQVLTPTNERFKYYRHLIILASRAT